MLPTEVRLTAGEVRDATRRLVTHGHQLSDHADGLIHEAETAASTLRKTMNQSL